jgi:hypothetical protein
VKGQFPPDQDLAPGDITLATVVKKTASTNDARRILQRARDSYPGPCDVILLAVPEGKGLPFLSGLGMALEADGKLVHRHGVE